MDALSGRDYRSREIKSADESASQASCFADENGPVRLLGTHGPCAPARLPFRVVYR